jgi:hypothetical protein
MSMGGKGGSALPPLYMGLIIPGERLVVKLPKFGLVLGCEGTLRDFDLGAGQRLKLVVLPLKALIFRENFAEGSEAKEVSLEFGFKLIFIIYKIFFFRNNYILLIFRNSL